ncbi:MAG: zeta toxin family protein [Deltaproteobacteria bacterium]|nr:zeta toxin family protein [Deltaproteobacteria bacterium]
MTIRLPPGVPQKVDGGARTQKLAEKAAAEIQQRSVGVDGANPGLQALVISQVEKVVAADAWVKEGKLSTADVAGLKVKVASATAKALTGLSTQGAAQNAATALRHAEMILAQQAKVIASVSAQVANDGPVDVKLLARDLAALQSSGANIGSLLAHDLWYADALSRTVQGSKSDDVGVDLGDGKKARARPFMAPSSVILESGDPKLIATMEGLNIAGVQAAITGLLDAATSTFASLKSTGSDGDGHFASAKALPESAGAHPWPSTSKEGIAPSTANHLKKVGAEIVRAHQSFARGQEPDWSALPLAHGALKGSHQRWLQKLSYEPGATQKVDFDRLSVDDKKNTVSSVLAAVYGTMKAAGMLPDELVAGVPLYLARAGSGAGDNVQATLRSIGGKPAIALLESFTGEKAARFTLKVDGKPVAWATIQQDGNHKARAAVADVKASSLVEVVDTETGSTRRLILPAVTAAIAPLQGKAAVNALLQLERDLKKTGARVADVVDAARGLIGHVGDDRRLHAQLEKGAPALLQKLAFAVVGGDQQQVAFINAKGKIDTLAMPVEGAAATLAKVKQLALGASADGLLREVLKRSGGNVVTSSAYTLATELPQKGKWDYLDGLAHWTPERRELHESLYARSLALATGLNQVIGAGGKPTVFAMRGNTAVGKTRTLANVDTLKSGAAFLKDNPAASINPDPIKAELVAAEAGKGVKVSSNQVHEEGSAISWRLLQAMQKEAMSMIVDRRLGSPNDVSDIIAAAEANGKAVELIDVDAKLAFSVMGVLMRKPGGVDPIVPFSAIAYGFAEVRDGRLKVIERAIESEAVTRYDLFATANDGSKVCVAQKRDGQLEIKDTALFDSCVAPPHDEVERMRTQIVDAAFVDQLTSGLPKPFLDDAKQALLRYAGLTLQAALEAHGKSAA